MPTTVYISLLPNSFMATAGKTTYKNTWFKIYGSVDGLKVCDVALIHHTRKDDETEDVKDKGYKLRFEFTNDGFKTKKIIMLEKMELTEVLSVLKGVSNNMESKRKDPLKAFSLKNQGDTFYISFRQGKENYWFKVTRFDAVRIVALILTALQKNFATDMGVVMTKDEILSSFDVVYTAVYVEQPKVVETTEVVDENAPVKTVEASEKVVEASKNTDTCSDCGVEMDKVKFEKVIKYSNSKFGKCLCMNCQKKQ